MQSTLAVISLRRIIKNAALVKARAKVPLFAVVKDDAYGHGAEKVSLALEPHVHGFCVATVLEGASLRAVGVQKEILVLTPCLSEEELLSCAAYTLTPTVSSLSSFRLARGVAEKHGFSLRFHLKVNTGMNRYGVPPDRVEAICREAMLAGNQIEGVFSHLYAPEDENARNRQTELFIKATEKVRRYYPNAVRHLAASGGILAGEQYRFDAVRSGIALYGYLPSGFEGAMKVKPAMKIYATVAQGLRFLGGGIGYQKAEKNYDDLSVLRLGYGDGFWREGKIGNESKLCMDAFVKIGREKFGSRKLIIKDAAAYARAHNTIVYEALVNVGRRAEKVYV